MARPLLARSPSAPLALFLAQVRPWLVPAGFPARFALFACLDISFILFHIFCLPRLFYIHIYIYF